MFHSCWFILHSSFWSCVGTFRYIEVHFTFGLLDCAHYNEDFIISRFVISRFCPIHFTVTLAGLQNIVCYTEDFVILRFVKSRFHCIKLVARLTTYQEVSFNLLHLISVEAVIYKVLILFILHKTVALWLQKV